MLIIWYASYTDLCFSLFKLFKALEVDSKLIILFQFLLLKIKPQLIHEPPINNHFLQSQLQYPLIQTVQYTSILITIDIIVTIDNIINEMLFHCHYLYALLLAIILYVHLHLLDNTHNIFIIYLWLLIRQSQLC